MRDDNYLHEIDLKTLKVRNSALEARLNRAFAGDEQVQHERADVGRSLQVCSRDLIQDTLIVALSLAECSFAALDLAASADGQYILACTGSQLLCTCLSVRRFRREGSLHHVPRSERQTAAQLLRRREWQIQASMLVSSTSSSVHHCFFSNPRGAWSPSGKFVYCSTEVTKQFIPIMNLVLGRTIKL